VCVRFCTEEGLESASINIREQSRAGNMSLNAWRD
jgi:hypothetical protein